jgi:hypothetical protein
MSTNVTNALLNVKANKINQVNESLGSLFTKDDVKNIIEKLFNEIDDVLIEQTSETETNVSKDVFLKMVSDALDSIDSDYYLECTMLENQTFTINYSNEVELDNYDVDFDILKFKREVLSIVSEQYENNVVVAETNANA